MPEAKIRQKTADTPKIRRRKQGLDIRMLHKLVYQLEYAILTLAVGHFLEEVVDFGW